MGEFGEAMATFDDFLKLDIRVGEIIQCEVFKKAKKPAYKLLIDFGKEIGLKKSSAQIAKQYTPNELIGMQILGVVNFPPKQIADFISEALVLGVYSGNGVVLVVPQQNAEKGDKLG